MFGDICNVRFDEREEVFVCTVTAGLRDPTEQRRKKKEGAVEHNVVLPVVGGPSLFGEGGGEGGCAHTRIKNTLHTREHVPRKHFVVCTHSESSL